MKIKAEIFAARAMQHIYRKLLEKIIHADYDVYQKNIKVSKVQKVGIALGVLGKIQPGLLINSPNLLTSLLNLNRALNLNLFEE